jgi:hypothetical protein
MGPVHIQQKRVGICYAKLVFSHQVGSVGHVVHSGASGVRNVDALFFMLGLHRYGHDKKRYGTCYTKIVISSGGICRSRSSLHCV